jgi:hypothetical protein
MHRWLVLLVLAAGACGGGGSTTYENDARAALNGGDMPKAIHVAEDGLAQDAVKKDPAAAWRLEQIRLDALATSRKGADVKQELDRLAAIYPKQVSASLYRSLADKAKTVNDVPGAIEILTAGDQRFPAEHASFVDAIGALKGGAAMDPATVKRLKALGYL